MKKIKYFILWFIIIAILISIFIFFFRRFPLYFYLTFWGVDYFKLGNLIVLSITLIVIMIYTYDTNRIANIQQKIYFTPQVVHEVSATEKRNNVFDIGFDLFNLSHFYVKAYAIIELKCFNKELIINNSVYYGKRPWNIPPNSRIHGHFKLDNNLLKQADMTASNLRKQKNNPKALTLKVNIECTSTHDISMKTPQIKYHFVYDRKINGSTWSGWVLDI